MIFTLLPTILVQVAFDHHNKYMPHSYIHTTFGLAVYDHYLTEVKGFQYYLGKDKYTVPYILNIRLFESLKQIHKTQPFSGCLGSEI